MLTEDGTHWQNLYDREAVEIQSRLLPVISSSSPLENIVQLGSAAVIIFENSFYIFDKRGYVQGQQKPVPSFYVALEQYMASPHAAAVREGVSAAVQAYEEAVTTAAHVYEEAVKAFVYTYQGNLPAWMVKLPVEPLKRKARERSQRSFARSKEEEKESSCSRAKEELIKAILEITLNYRLPRP
ncbi:hypothetical protein BDR06DRAFT_958912 [Suillus hirtellus]|nr:hypothetical protein BDR06DRAFT_958912 [Suillus hirtellus]